jgi:hypothetical protein
MGMFSKSSSSSFKPTPYGRRPRSSRIVPRWLILLLFGVALGAGGLFYVQEKYGPERITLEHATQLRNDLSRVENDRQSLQSRLTGAEEQLGTARARADKLASELQATQASFQRLQADMELFEEVLPPDPRGSALGIRAARFGTQGNGLTYHVLLTRADRPNNTFNGEMRLAAEGRTANGSNMTIDLAPVKVALGRYQHLRGTLQMPEGFVPRQITVRVMDSSNRQQALRVLNVRGS